jgi:hypothetical protein
MPVLESSTEHRETSHNYDTLNLTIQPEQCEQRPLLEQRVHSPKSMVQDTKRRKRRTDFVNKKLKFFIKFKLG